MRRAVILLLGFFLLSLCVQAPATAHGRGRYGYSYYHPYSYHAAGHGYYSWYSPWPAYRFYYNYPAVYTPYPAAPVAFVDTDVSPEEAEVWLNGTYLGVADRFDGFPRYLTLDPGNHVIEFRYKGRRTERSEIEVRAGSFLRFKFKMLPESEPSTEDALPVSVAEEIEPGFIRLRIVPDDASVYIDGALYGSAATLAGLHGDLRLTAGEHVIEIVRPGYSTTRRTLHLQSGDHLNLSLDLASEDDAR